MALTKTEKRLIDIGKNDRMAVLLPGMAHPPMVVPYCRICGLSAEKYDVKAADWYYLEIVANCCGKQQGRRVTIEEVRRVLANPKDKLWLVVGKRQSQGVASRADRISVGGRTFKRVAVSK